MIRNRHHAGERMSEFLEKYRGDEGSLVLGVPRGGVVVASSLSRKLDLPLDVFICHRLKAPWNPEVAVGAVTETGCIHLDEKLLEAFPMPSDILVDELREEKHSVSNRRDLYRGGRAIPSLQGRRILLVDDGVVTGLTMLAAIRALRELKPQSIVAVVPVGPAPAIQSIRKAADDLVVLEHSRDLAPIHSHYESFEPVTDIMVIEALAPHRSRRKQLL